MDASAPTTGAVEKQCAEAVAKLEREAKDHPNDFALERALKIPKELPDVLRTHHWYNDLHHAMFLILFVNSFRAIKEGSNAAVEHYVDNITLYLFVHFIIEEEGMVYAALNHGLSGAFIETHTATHVKFIKWWNRNIFSPFKGGDMGRLALHGKMVEFAEKLIDHIDTVDIETYGAKKRDEKVSRNEISHMAKCGLPLSPFMPGARTLMEILAPQMSERLNEGSLSPQAIRPLPPPRLVNPDMRLWSGDKGAFRDVFLEHIKGNRTRRIDL